MKEDTSFNASELPFVSGRVYHLGLNPGELSENIIIVGDPDRVPLIAEEFLSVTEIDQYHRGLRTITGEVRETGQRVSIVTSGMGTPSLEIVINEISALHEINLEKGIRKEEPPMITIIRVGTSGCVQKETELGTLIITDYAVGLDNTGLFYDVQRPDDRCLMIERKIYDAINERIGHNSRFRGKIVPYASRAHQDVVEGLDSSARDLGVPFQRGITVSSSGFFANQGRSVSRVPPTVPDIDGILAAVHTGIEGLRIENMEMEASFLLHFTGSVGYRGGVICPVIDQRRQNIFLENYSERVRDATRVALKTLYILSKP